MKDITNLLGASIGLYALPDVYSAFDRKLQEENTTNSQLADVIKVDSGLTSYLLKTVNSPLYGFPMTISDISHAISIIGRNELATLVIGKCVIDVFSKLSVNKEILQKHWENSLHCAINAKLIGSISKKNKVSAESLFIAGLIHGIGKLSIWHMYPNLAEMFANAASEMDYIYKEREELGFDYTDVGGYLTENWNLPSFFYDVITKQLDPLACKENTAVCIIALSKEIAKDHADDKKDIFLESTLSTKLDILSLNTNDLELIMEVSTSQMVEMKLGILS